MHMPWNFSLFFYPFGNAIGKGPWLPTLGYNVFSWLRAVIVRPENFGILAYRKGDALL